MKYIILLIFVFHTSNTFSQRRADIGYLKLKNCKIISQKKEKDVISGYQARVIKLTIKSKNKLQTSCNIVENGPERFNFVESKFTISYIYDKTGVIYDSMMNEIQKYLVKNGKNVLFPNTVDYSFHHKSFFVNDSLTVPYIETDGDGEEDYSIFYIDKHVYKIKCIESGGLGCLSTFIFENTYFMKNNQILDLGRYILDEYEAKRISKRKI